VCVYVRVRERRRPQKKFRRRRSDEGGIQIRPSKIGGPQYFAYFMYTRVPPGPATGRFVFRDGLENIIMYEPPSTVRITVLYRGGIIYTYIYI